MNSKHITLKQGREKAILNRHPWIFSGAIQSKPAGIQSGETVEVLSANGEWLARGAYSPVSKIRVRIWTWDQNEAVDSTFFKQRIHSAIELRNRIISTKEGNARRLVFGESDGIPGLVVDQYGEVLVLQFLSAGAEYWRDTIVNCLKEMLQPQTIYERSDVEVRELEGLTPQEGLLFGENSGSFIIEENGLKFLVDPANGQKTGFYLDQRHNRQIVRDRMIPGAELLNCFCYTGGFSIYAMAGGAAHVTSIDSSADAIELSRKNLALNHFGEEDATWIIGDVFQELRTFRDSRRMFDVIILDPPKFAPTAAQANRAARGYKDINLLAMKLLRPGGYLYTFSCSGGISASLFQKIVAGAAVDAQCDLRIIRQLHQDRDHPIAVNYPESAYLKGLFCVKG